MPLHDMAKMTVVGSPGTGAITLGATSVGFQSFSAAGVVNGEELSISVIQPNGKFEVGSWTYSSTGPTLTRVSTLASSNSGFPENFNSTAVVAITALSKDFPVPPSGMLSFATVAAAQEATILDSQNYIQISGFNAPGDNGGGVYKRVSSLQSPYVGSGNVPVVVPPGLTSGGLPVLVFSSTGNTAGGQTQRVGPTIAPIVAHNLVVMIMTQLQPGTVTPPASIVDSIGNSYILATGTFNAGSLYPGGAAIYYCVDPAFVPTGSSFLLSGDPSISSPYGSLSVFSCPGFTGAVLNKTNNGVVGSGSGTIATAALTQSTPQLVFAFIEASRGAYISAADGALSYTVPTGWYDLSPPQQFGRFPLACTIATNSSPVTFSSTWTGPETIFPFPAAIATFSGFPLNAINPSFFTLQPEWPVHTAQYGISPSSSDNSVPFLKFTRWLASIAPPSGTSDGAGIIDSGTATISIANPAIITLTLPPYPAGNGMQHSLRNGQVISFNTTGQLPAPIVPGKRYYVQYGTVTGSPGVAGTIQISETSIFNHDFLSNTTAKGTPISTLGATQSGVHSWTTYGENWVDFIIDPGIYNANNHMFPGKGIGLKRWRAIGYGARFQSGAFVDGIVWLDVNANTDSSTVVYSAKFKTTKSDPSAPSSIILFTPAEAINFYVNSWVILMALELQGSTTINWNQYYFEYVKVQSVNVSTGVITFYDPLQYNYRSTYPLFPPPMGAWPGTSIGPATIVQISDTFDQEAEIYGVTFTGNTEMNFLGILSLRLVDCYIYGWGFKTGPFPSTMKKFIMERCVVENWRSEIDKMIDTQHYIDCTFDKFSNTIIQSSSTNKVIYERCRLNGGMPGTPKDLVLRDCFVAGTFIFGTTFGGTERVLLENTHIDQIDFASAGSVITHLIDTIFVDGTIKFLVGTTAPSVGTTWNGPGVVPSGCPILWSAPGTKVMVISRAVNDGMPGLGGPQTSVGYNVVKIFTVLDSYTDNVGNFCVDTDMQALPSTKIIVTGSIAVGTSTLVVTAISPTDALPLQGMTISGGDLPPETTITVAVGAPNIASPINTGTYTLSNPSVAGQPGGTTFVVSEAVVGNNGTLYYCQHPCPRLTVRDCTGGIFASDWSGALPDTPMLGYFKRAFAGFPLATYFGENQYLTLTGNLTSLTVDVKKPYTGSASTYICTISIIGWKNVGGNYYPTWVNQTINLQGAGLRTITSNSTTGLSGIIATLGSITAGSAYTNRVYFNVPLVYVSSGAGTGATANITVSGGVVTAVVLVNRGKNYSTSDSLTALAVDIGGTGSGFHIPVSTVSADSLTAVPWWITGTMWVATGTTAGNGIGSGTVGSGDTLAMMPVFVVTGQADQGIDFGSESVITTTSGTNVLFDTGTHSGNDRAPVPFTALKYYVAEGDSISAGAGVAGYPALYGAGNSAVTLTNLSTGGAFLSTLQQRQSTLDHIISFKRGGDHYVLSVMIGTNDACFGYTGGSQSAFLTQLAAYCSHQRSQGWYVIVCTQIARGLPNPTTPGSSPNSQLTGVNAEIQLWTTNGIVAPGVHADAICDFAGNSHFTLTGSVYNDTTYYLTDETHPNVTGENLLYTIIKPIIDAAI
jgi:lysophospholipase L1-like esterase